MEVPVVKRLKSLELEEENTKLKELLAAAHYVRVAN